MINLDPLASLIDYVVTVKPYHTKIYEVLLTYIYKEPIVTTVTEQYHISTKVVNPESDSRIVCPGVGWDTGPFDWNSSTSPECDADLNCGTGRWDYPLVCNDNSPNGIRAWVFDQLKIEITAYVEDLAFTYVQDHTQPIGWDMTRWDHTQWDAASVENWLEVSESTSTHEPVGATISESLVIQVI